MTFNVLIPARFDSTRLPGKPLLEAGGKPLVQWVHEAACRSAAERVVIATDDERILAAARSFGAEACLTSAGHVSGTDRICEAAELLGLDPDAVIVNLQGDEPQMPGALIDQVAAGLASSGASIATAAHAVSDPAELDDPNVVKVVCDRGGNAMYFSRSGIPYPRQAQPDGRVYRHLGIYAYRYGYLREFTARAPTVLERTECLEQLRALEYGDRIAVQVTDAAPPAGIDTADDLERFRRSLQA
ncbi:MAG TPA: 3-deoxy-manno-octulosonate cytidylyltransferase [Arenicellales bacterium]|nr:3-deoxy-manno-octulosonate cytidylyltransferase [Arenicellales bacterium]